MFQYQISCKNPASQYLQIQVKIPVSYPGKVKLQLPIWRAGRYFPSNYAQFVRNFSVRFENESMPFFKKNKSLWAIEVEKSGTYEVFYEFFAGTMDAGSAWVDDQQIYLNLVNCCMEISGTRHFSYEFQFKLPYPIRVCTLPEKRERTYFANNFQEVADSTLLASKDVIHWKFAVDDYTFHCWIHGAIHFEKQEFLDALKRIAISQIKDFGVFPELEYHFLFQLLPYQHYHGVEHKRGTVITYGPAEKLKQKKHLMELLGVSSHELYHAWNVCRIRPKDLLPYDFSSEDHTTAGWILEGITSYMGDLYLLKSGVVSIQDFAKKIQNTIQRVSEDFGWRNSSILESSFDTWVDGYHASAPDRKQNIYANGALIALGIDLMLLANGSSLAAVMQKAWIRFGKNNRGYHESSFWNLILLELSTGVENDFYTTYISGKNSIIPYLKENLPSLGLNLEERFEDDFLRNTLGIIVKDSEIKKIHPDSFAYQVLMLGDQIKSINTNGTLDIYRLNGVDHHFNIKKSENQFFPTYHIQVSKATPIREAWLA
ncbi:M61 family peptidase [Algoriphagus kandeliae]|uniref:M61 family peptidase n=1 Tax=Algoriphagus kandeliae TaxID=2562278 RepID=A0A4Y9QJ03_9BACT|nr:M61 family peptidase [Algoriphagus kandeliae]TFV92200.1 M61 family peptidase [Algoriphagus kandeliae]